MRIARVELTSQKAYLGGDEGETILGSQGQGDGTVVVGNGRQCLRRTACISELHHRGVAGSTLKGSALDDHLLVRALVGPLLGSKAGIQLTGSDNGGIVVVGDPTLVECVGNGPGNVHTGGVLRLAAHLDIRDAQPLACSIDSVPRIDANLQLVALLKFDDGGSVHFVHHTAGH